MNLILVRLIQICLVHILKYVGTTVHLKNIIVLYVTSDNFQRCQDLGSILINIFDKFYKLNYTMYRNTFSFPKLDYYM